MPSLPTARTSVATAWLLELQQAAGNQAVSQMLSGSAPAVVLRTSAAAGTPVVMRDPVPEVEAPAYIDKFGAELGDGVRDFLAQQEFGLPSPFLSWTTPKSFSTAALTSAGANDGKALVAKLPELIRPSELGELVNRGRKKGTVQVTDDKKTWTEEQSNLGPATWYPDVAVEVGQILAKRFIESIERIAPRYLDARVASVVAEEAARLQSLTDAPEPTDGILTSAAIDVLTADALKAGGVHFDWPGYHTANPEAVGNKQVSRQVVFSVEPAQNGTYWVRVTSPADPLPEEVALALFGATTMTPLLAVSSPPLFGFGDASGLRPEVEAKFGAAGVDTTKIGDAAAEGMKGPLADEIALGQSKVPAAADKMGVLAALNENLIVLDRFTGIGAAFGIGKDPTLGDVTQVRARLVKKQTELAAANDETAIKWAGQVKDQQKILSQAAFGFESLVERFEAMTKKVTDATAKLGGFNLPPYVREALHQVAMQYVEVAATSFFPATAEPKLQAADLANRLLPVRILEGTMAAIQRTVDDALADKRKEDSEHASYDTEGMRKREIELRARLGAIKVRLINNPMSVGEELAALQTEILCLQTEAEIVGNMDQLDMAWQALDDSLSFWFSSLPTRVKIEALKAAGDDWHARWKGIFSLWKKGDKASRDQAKSQLDALRADPKLGEYFGLLKSTIKDAQIEVMIGKLVALLVITIVTMGVGEFVAGAALGAELSTGATLVAVGGAEAVTMTVLSQILLDTDHSAGHVAWELATNFAMFSALRRFSAFAEVAKLGKVTAATGQAVLLGAMGLAKEEIAKYARTGKHLTRDEIGQIALQSLVMFVALNGVGKLAEPMLKGIKAEGTMLALRRNAANRAGEGLKTMQEGLAGSKDPTKALQYIEAERAWLELKIKAYDELEAAAKAEATSGKKPKDGGVLKQAGMTLAEVTSMKASLGKHMETMAAARTMLSLAPLAPGVYGAPRAKMAEVLAQLGGGTLVKTDPVSKIKTYEAKSPDGKKVTIVEQLDQYDRWLLDVQHSLDAAELAKFEKMTGKNTSKEVHDRYSGDKDLAVRKVKEAVAYSQGKADIKTGSAERMAELKLRIADNKLMQDPDVVAIVDALPAKGRPTTISNLRDTVMAKILAGEALAKAKVTEPNAEVLTGIKVYEKQAENSIAEWEGNNPDKTGNGLTMRGRDLYMQRGEIDIMVVVREPSGKARVTHREEIKTGTTDTHAGAKEQLDSIGDYLAQGSSGKIRLELNGRDITTEIDMSTDAAATKATRGPADKKFDESLGVTAGDLERLIKSLLTEATAKPAPGKDTK
jgi:hypothetical protein